MSKSTFKGYIRELGSTNKTSSDLPGPTPRVMTTLLKVEFDASQASAATGLVIPSNCRVMSARSMGAASAGTVDVGTLADPDGFASGIAASAVADQATGALIGTLNQGEKMIYAGDNTGGAGTAVVYLEVVMDDDGSIQN